GIVILFFFQAEDGIRDGHVTGVQTCALPISGLRSRLDKTFPRRRSLLLRDTRCPVRSMPKNPSSRFPGAGAAKISPDRTSFRPRSEERRVGKECRSRWGP